MPDKLIGATCFPDTLPRYKTMYELATTASFGWCEELFVQDRTVPRGGGFIISRDVSVMILC
jgi:hypothetical protein